ncbi:bifunctional 2-polyprenyl-6-hydroxyphenol methylase/3-demethylubiquinol 3-O-methyltransferase UbiG [Caulobacter sp. CCH5-E12]|uniref:class I SAM-dependent methyltransferase n=1 Tax=Caulobacter sp. CCH5-E12 TaxID=1768770 RepID=UPI0007811623|nr:class I SAM-dependent methyltransferase [Caulobacter sp. CCH5-E12]
MIASAAFYNPRAEELSERYSGARFEEVHAGLLPHLPPRGATIADVGAGSGRDAFALARLGYRVTAIEPSPGMREWAMSRRPTADVRWIDDALPDLGLVRAEGRMFDFVLCSAVLMHLPATTLVACFATLAAITAPGGNLAISVRAPISGDPKAIFHAHSALALEAAAKGSGLALRDHGESVDLLGRQLVKWRWMVFQHS